MHHKHVFSEIRNVNYFSTQRPNRAFVLDSEQKIRHSDN